MSEWWDERVQRYRTSLVSKVFYEWGWPIMRAVMHRLPEEPAHHAAIRGIWLVGKIDRVWTTFTSLLLVSVILALYGLSKLPGFSWRESDED